MSNLAKKTILSVALVFAFGTASGEPTFTDEIKFAPPIDDLPAYYIHDITDGTTDSPGFHPGAGNHITSATLTLHITGASEGDLLRLTIGNTDWYYEDEDIPNKISIDLTGEPLSQLDTTGQLAYTISAISGDFKFHGSTLEAVDPPAGANIPEPATLALLGTGLFGIGAVRRRQR